MSDPRCHFRTRPDDWCRYDGHRWCGMVPGNTYDGKLTCHHPDGPQPCPLCAGTGKEHDNDGWCKTPCACQDAK